MSDMTERYRYDERIERRPGGVTAVFVLTYIVGIANVLLGIGLVLASFLPQTSSARARFVVEGAVLPPVAVLPAGLVLLILGGIVLKVARGVRDGQSGARLVLTVVMVLQILGAFSVTTVGTAWQPLSTLVLPVIVLALLWTGRAKTYFR